jgi:hypothetical protein
MATLTEQGNERSIRSMGIAAAKSMKKNPVKYL